MAEAKGHYDVTFDIISAPLELRKFLAEWSALMVANFFANLWELGPPLLGKDKNLVWLWPLISH
jgi:hypothetical protein